MRIHVFKLLVLPLVVFAVGAWLVINQPAIAAPPDNPPLVIGNVAEKAGVTLEKQASAETVALGQVVTYTVTIKNDSAQTVSPKLTDKLPKLPDGLALQTESITTTSGSILAVGNSVEWSGSLAPGEQVTVKYSAIPPSTSQAGQTQENVAALEFGETRLEAAATITTTPPSLGIWGSFVNFIAIALVYMDKVLQQISVPYAFGFAIILFTVIVRAATFPLNMQQIKSSKAMQELQPQLKALQEKHKGDREKLAQEQMALYKEAGVNPLGGCLPMLVQMPVWFALYQSLIQLSTEGLLSEGFLWIPSLAGPVADYSGGLSWLWPLPPSIGWGPALAYLVMPVLLVVSQIYMQNLMSPPSSDPQQAQMQSIMKFMPLMFGYFALIVPSGLTLYWFTSNILGLAQHYFTKSQLDVPASTKAASARGSAVSTTPVRAAVGENKAVTVTSGDDDKETHGKSKRRKKSRRKR